ncbi:MAG: cell division protein SepF [bacterium]|nr:cell division protein SepF [bacterium]
MALDKFKNFLSGKEDETNTEYYNNDETESENKMILLEPRAYSESQQIADYLKSRSAVVVNLKRVTPDQAKRIVDFLSGTLYAIGGDLQKLGGGIFLCTPNNINVEGKITDENAPVKSSKGKKQDDEEEFNW